MAFDLGELLKNVSDSDTGREQIEYIKLDLIDGDEQNFYELSEVDALANNIATIGLQQPLRVRPHPTAEGRYMVVSGHRRRTALQLLAQENPTRWEEVACIVDRDTVSPAMQQLRLIFGNANTRKMSSSDLSEQAAQVEKLLYQLKEDGYEFPGRMRDHVAQVVQTSKTKLAKLKMIRDNLAACWQPDYKKDILGESSAYELSRMPEARQILLFEEKLRTKANIRYLYADDIKKFAERCAAIVACSCDKTGDGVCVNQEAKFRKAAVTERYSFFYCGKCCADCPHLTSCKSACPKLKDKVAQIKADAKEKRRQEQAAQEELDRPKIEKLQQLWYRFGIARSVANASVADVYKAAGMYYAQTDDQKMKDMEDLWAKFTPETTLPYGYSFHLSDAKKLIAVADLLGCSLDYLFCRTDVLEMAQDSPKEKVPEADAAQIIPGAWYPPSVEPPLNERIIILDKDGYADTSKYRGGEDPLDKYCIARWPEEVKLWSLVPNGASCGKGDA
jgi:ParB family chromosome partitioning protein